MTGRKYTKRFISILEEIGAPAQISVEPVVQIIEMWRQGRLREVGEVSDLAATVFESWGEPEPEPGTAEFMIVEALIALPWSTIIGPTLRDAGDVLSLVASDAPPNADAQEQLLEQMYSAWKERTDRWN